MNGGQIDPRMEDWQATTRTFREDWTGRGQGVATDGRSWFVTSNDSNPGLFRYSADFSQLEAQVDIPRSLTGHVGAVAVNNDTVLVALEKPEMVAIFNLDLTDRSLVEIERPVETDGEPHLAWCAVNPANGLLYTCNWIDAIRLDAYELDTGERRTGEDIDLAESVNRTQGGVFSPNGGVYLASDDRISFIQQIGRLFGRTGDEDSVFPGIHGFDVSSGSRLGYIRIPTRPYFPHFEEIEGVGLGPMTVGGQLAHVHVALLDINISWIDDDVSTISYQVPDPDQI